MVLCFLGPFWLLTKLGFKEGLLALFGGGGRERFYRHARSVAHTLFWGVISLPWEDEIWSDMVWIISDHT